MCSPKMLRLGSASESETKKHEYFRNLDWAAEENRFIQPEFPEFGLHGLNETVYWSQLDRWESRALQGVDGVGGRSRSRPPTPSTPYPP